MTAAQLMAIHAASATVGPQEAAIACFLAGYAAGKSVSLSTLSPVGLLASITAPSGTLTPFKQPEQR